MSESLSTEHRNWRCVQVPGVGTQIFQSREEVWARLRSIRVEVAFKAVRWSEITVGV